MYTVFEGSKRLFSEFYFLYSYTFLSNDMLRVTGHLSGTCVRTLLFYFTLRFYFKIYFKRNFKKVTCSNQIHE